MTSDSMPPDRELGPADKQAPPPVPASRQVITRTASLWTAVTVALLLLVLLVVFILQNADRVRVRFFGLAGSLPLGVALLIAAVGGGLVVAIAGVGRISQLRLRMRRTKRRNAARSLHNE